MIFNFYWSWYEDFDSNLLEHPDKTPKEFEKDCMKALVDSFDQYFEITKKESHWASMQDWIEFSIKNMKEYGYKVIKPVAFGFFGGMIVDKKIKNIEKKLYKNFPKQMKIMSKYNKVLDGELYKDIYEKIEKENNE